MDKKKSQAFKNVYVYMCSLVLERGTVSDATLMQSYYPSSIALSQCRNMIKMYLSWKRVMTFNWGQLRSCDYIEHHIPGSIT